MLLPDPWSCGRRDAQRLAPLLLEEITAQGWQLDDDLARQLTHNPGGVKSYPVTLEKKRIPNLPLREAVQRRPLAPAGPDRTGKCVKPGHGGGTFALDDCPECKAAELAARPKQERSTADELRRLGQAGFLAALRDGTYGAAGETGRGGAE